MESNKSSREPIDTAVGKNFTSDAQGGKYKESDDVGKSVSEDVRKAAKAVVRKGQGDKGDGRPRRVSK